MYEPKRHIISIIRCNIIQDLCSSMQYENKKFHLLYLRYVNHQVRYKFIFYDYAYCLKRFHSFLNEKFIKNELTVVLNMA